MFDRRLPTVNLWLPTTLYLLSSAYLTNRRRQARMARAPMAISITEPGSGMLIARKPVM